MKRYFQGALYIILFFFFFFSFFFFFFFCFEMIYEKESVEICKI